MSQSDKARYYQALKAEGVEFTKHYREYSTSELKIAWDQMNPGREIPQMPPAAAPAQPAPQAARSAPPLAQRDPNELAGQRLNSKTMDDPIRTDEDGKVWFQEEVLKPAYPKPRGRRVMKYMDAGSVEKTVVNGDYVETFEVSGDPQNAKMSEVKVTLPSFQVGVYRDPRFPFKVITYNGNEGFDLVGVQNFYGGSELVPPSVKRKYVENVLCYDIRSVVAAINAEYRQQQLSGRIK